MMWDRMRSKEFFSQRRRVRKGKKKEERSLIKMFWTVLAKPGLALHKVAVI